MDVPPFLHITFAGAEQTYSVKIPEHEFEEAAELSRRSGYEKALTSE
jgi:hypothetical protein